ncbi:DNA-binding response regulator, OmpR family, contains REC and winged-helix (wHTH) domain [Anaerovirgula multivorans]|uniref:Stage 0 sporulation protein A homolog n=1 Tax=Anaerovirgula multivorans TaxID=312168 RepID=A0A239F7V2_9FIRM|nr:response regulator transcription factor [Anaerovirgula multivorans]SNS53110.1 DNA-binding response regulator, OmpR family, contains REC and winged-helix (wHTH) domain [Anaerovirgula multivorans]
MVNKKILIIEDEEAISNLISYSLKKEGFITNVAATGEEGLKLLKEFKPDLIILDLMLPDISGFEICKTITREYIIPIIMITAKSDTVDKILGMELGADDYITKPFDIREVIARIKAVFRRIDLISEAGENNEFEGIRIGKNIEIFKEKREVFKDNTRVELANKEYELLVFLAESKGRVFSRADLLDRVWGFEFAGDTRTVDIHVQRLRKKLDENKNSSIIETVFGIGYKIL